MDATWLEQRIFWGVPEARVQNARFSCREVRYSGKGPIMTFVTAIVFGMRINVKYFLEIRWNSLRGNSVVCDSPAWNK